MVMNLVYVAFGGALGSVLRVLVGLAATFPFGTLTVNVLGSFLIGLLWANGIDKAPGLNSFLMLGVLGGFTTFSTFSLDVLKLMEGGQLAASAAYVLASVFLSVGACFGAAYLVTATQ